MSNRRPKMRSKVSPEESSEERPAKKAPDPTEDFAFMNNLLAQTKPPARQAYREQPAPKEARQLNQQEELLHHKKPVFQPEDSSDEEEQPMQKHKLESHQSYLERRAEKFSKEFSPTESHLEGSYRYRASSSEAKQVKEEESQPFKIKMPVGQSVSHSNKAELEDLDRELSMKDRLRNNANQSKNKSKPSTKGGLNKEESQVVVASYRYANRMVDRSTEQIKRHRKDQEPHHEAQLKLLCSAGRLRPLR